MNGPKNKEEEVSAFPILFGAGIQVHPNIAFGIEHITYGSVDVPNGKRKGLSYAPTIEGQYYPRRRKTSPADELNTLHFFGSIGYAQQVRWGADLPDTTGNAMIGTAGLRVPSWPCRVTFDLCGYWVVDVHAIYALTDYLVKPVILPAGAAVLSGSLQFLFSF